MNLVTKRLRKLQLFFFLLMFFLSYTIGKCKHKICDSPVHWQNLQNMDFITYKIFTHFIQNNGNNEPDKKLLTCNISEEAWKNTKEWAKCIWRLEMVANEMALTTAGPPPKAAARWTDAAVNFWQLFIWPVVNFLSCRLIAWASTSPYRLSEEGKSLPLGLTDAGFCKLGSEQGGEVGKRKQTTKWDKFMERSWW